MKWLCVIWFALLALSTAFAQTGDGRGGEPGNDILLYAAALTVIAYIATLALSKLGFAGIHRLFWNFVLMSSFVLTFITTLILLAQRYNLISGVHVSFYHTLFGAIFLFACLFHFFGHMTYYVSFARSFVS